MSEFQKGDKILCYHGSLMYEAKCLNIERRNKGTRYLVHYAGWKKNWDEWVSEDRILKYTDANLKKSKELLDAHEMEKNPKRTSARLLLPKSNAAHKDSTSQDKSVAKLQNVDQVQFTKFSVSENILEDEILTAPAGESMSGRTLISKGKCSSGNRRGVSKVASCLGKHVNSQQESDASKVLHPSLPLRKRRAGRAKVSIGMQKHLDSQQESDTSKVLHTSLPVHRRRARRPKRNTSMNVPHVEKYISPVLKGENASSAGGNLFPSISRMSQDRKTKHAEESLEEDSVLEVIGLGGIPQVIIPEELRPFLVLDCTLITKHKKLINLPVKLPVAVILENYVKERRISSHVPIKESAIKEVADGLKEFFDAMLGSHLLYNFEKFQYVQILETLPQTSMSKIYGAIHLLRLFVKIGKMLPVVPVDETSLHDVVMHIDDIFRYLVKNSSTLFSKRVYINSSSEYQRRALMY